MKFHRSNLELRETNDSYRRIFELRQHTVAKFDSEVPNLSSKTINAELTVCNCEIR
jgi:hypothetical protein